MPKKFAGIDCSTNSIAYGVISDGQLIHYGEEFFKGSTVFERMLDAKYVTAKLVANGQLDVDVVVFEAAIRVKSTATALKLAYVFGVCMAEIMSGGARVIDVAPLTWQSGIGNPALKPAEKLAIKRANPGKSPTWYAAKNRETRKQRTLSIVNNEFGINVTSDNIGDSIGIALYGAHKLG